MTGSYGASDTLVAGAAVGALVLSAHAMLNALLLRRPAGMPPTAGVGLVSVLIPARNEAARIAATIGSVLAQRDVTVEVIVLDDASADATVDVVAAVAGDDRRLRTLTGTPLPPGWMGKPWACHQLGQAARGDVLVFVDADVRLEPHAVAAAVDLLRRHGLALVSPYPRQEAVTTAERLVQPLLQWLWMTFLPLRWAERPRPASMAAANGQFMVFDAGAYRSIGGHSSVRARVVEDVWLARAVKRTGRRAAVVDGTSLATCRMYGNWNELSEGYSKSLWAAVDSPGGAVSLATLLAVLYVLPPLAVVSGLAVGRRRRMAWGAAGYLAGVGGRIISARTTGGRVGDAFAHPVSVTVLIGLLARSRRLRRRGLLVWKGRPVTDG